MSLSVGASLLSAQTPPDGDPASVYRALPAIGAAAERAGFDSVWASEHHLATDGYLPSPLIALAAIAGATSRITLGSGVVLAPLWRPLRLAEDALTLQMLSGGRLTLGLGLGYRAAEYRAHGVPMSVRGRLLAETVVSLRRLWAGETLDIDDERGGGHGLWLRPAPAPTPPIWLGGYAPRAVERAARLADGFLVGGGDEDTVSQVLDRLDAAGPPGDFDVAVQQIVLPHDGPVDPGMLRLGLRHQEQTYAQWQQEDEPRSRPLRTFEGRPDAEGTIGDVVDALTPVLSRLGRYRRAHLLCRVVPPGLEATPAVELIEDLGQRLLPRLRERWDELAS